MLALALIAIWTFEAPLTRHSTPTQQLLRDQWKQCADVVVVGDSTARQGIDVAIIEHALGDTYRVASFTYPAVSIVDDHYLTAAETVLDSANPDRTLVIALNSWDTRQTTLHPYEDELEALGRAIESGHPPGLALDWRDELDLRLGPRGLCALLWNACPWQTTYTPARGGQLIIEQWHADETFAVPETLFDLGAEIAEPHRRGPKALGDLVRNEVARLTPILKAAAAQ